MSSSETAVTSSNLVAQLNQRWRVVALDGTQWILQRLHENDWRARSHCRTRYALERCVQAYAGDVDPAARAILNALPLHIDWTQKPRLAPPARREDRQLKGIGADT
jgi:hypothetical protein